MWFAMEIVLQRQGQADERRVQKLLPRLRLACRRARAMVDRLFRPFLIEILYYDCLDGSQILEPTIREMDYHHTPHPRQYLGFSTSLRPHEVPTGSTASWCVDSRMRACGLVVYPDLHHLGHDGTGALGEGRRVRPQDEMTREQYLRLSVSRIAVRMMVRDRKKRDAEGEGRWVELARAEATHPSQVRTHSRAHCRDCDRYLGQGTSVVATSYATEDGGTSFLLELHPDGMVDDWLSRVRVMPTAQVERYLRGDRRCPFCRQEAEETLFAE